MFRKAVGRFIAAAVSLAMLNASAEAEITLLDSIESTGVQWIGTDVPGNTVYGLKAGIAVTDKKYSWQYLMGGASEDFTIGNSGSGGDNPAACFLRYQKLEKYNNKTGATADFATGVCNDIAVMDGDFTINGVVKATGLSGALDTTKTPIAICNTGNGTATTRPSPMVVYYLQLFDADGEAIADLIPAKRTADGAVGLWDAKRKRFLESTGTAAFTAGAVSGTRRLGQDGELELLTKITAPNGVHYTVNGTEYFDSADVWLKSMSTMTLSVSAADDQSVKWLQKPADATPSGSTLTWKVSAAASISFGIRTFPAGGELKLAEYIETDGAQYIDTDFYPNGDTTLEIKLGALYAADQPLWAYGTFNVWKSNAFACRLTPNKQGYADVTAGFAESASLSVGNGPTYVFRQEPGKFFSDGVQKATGLGTSFAAPYSLTLLAAQSDAGLEVTPVAGWRIYSAKVWDGETLVRDYLACVQDGVAGLYDQANGRFYAGSGTGTFTAGPEPTDVRFGPDGSLEYLTAVTAPAGTSFTVNGTLYTGSQSLWLKSSVPVTLAVSDATYKRITWTKVPAGAVTDGATCAWTPLSPAEVAFAINPTYFVRKGGDDDANDGLSPQMAFATFEKGFAMMNAAEGNTLDLGEGEFTCDKILDSVKKGSTIQGAGPGKTTLRFGDGDYYFTMANAEEALPSVVRQMTLTSTSGHKSVLVWTANNTVLEDLVVANAAGNTSDKGMVYLVGSKARMTRVVIHGCTALRNTAGVYLNSGNGLVENCLFYDNAIASDSADSGANGYWYDWNTTLNNCTFGRSTMELAPSFHEADNSNCKLNNCLFYSKNETAGAVKANCLVWGEDDYATKWTDYENGDYTLTKAATDAIDQGLTIEAIKDDLIGVRRPQGAGYDIGCYELDLSQTPWGRITGSYIDAGETKDGHCFILTSDGEMTLSKSASIRRYLVVGGGGAGGVSVGGGGAGGQVVANDRARLKVEKGAKISFKVGLGGVSGKNEREQSGNGGDSSLTIGAMTISAVGGGGGASRYVLEGLPVPGSDGANGGGGACGILSAPGLGGAPTVEDGFAGGKSYYKEVGGQAGGGGAGAGGAGGDSGLSGLDERPYTAGTGGAGVTSDITGVELDYAAGGGGGGSPNGVGQQPGYGSLPGAAGGESAGAGGGGSQETKIGFAGLANRGGGGGGGYDLGGAGGSGAVIVVLAPVVGFRVTVR